MLEPSCRLGCGISLMDCCSVSVSSAIVISLFVPVLVESAVQAVEVLGEDVLAQLVAAGRGLQPGVLAGEVAPGLVAGEQDAVRPGAAPLDFGPQPARGEADGPGQVGVDLLAGRDPVEEARPDQLDVPAHPAAEVDQVQLDV